MPLSIIHFPHPTLRHVSRPIVRVDAKLKSMAEEMLELMYEFDGVGLAANQVDLPLRMFVCNPTGKRDEGEPWIVLNPEIDRPKGNDTAQEGCLSVPGIYGQVKRPKSVRLRGFDLQGNDINQVLDGFIARVVQHEVDHLDGIMFFDRMGEEGLRDLEGHLDEFQTDYASKQGTGSIADEATLAKQRAEWETMYTGGTTTHG
ncbi:peptide deformylase [Rhodopirellula sp. JC740]|uniref:Peptide deformylase n=1 Tax=Rhodopirellula halodulae TaxID=2894198 RepID=A0ABS8NG34_9BACT|nr:peptide deformylase [Rhodopirellula sp. JC740]MCC9642509.1 peptide deformylase [Rhodopirellula sp. JC740]